METETNERPAIGLWDWLIPLALAAIAFFLYWGTMADYVFPGESAHLLAVWNGLDVSTYENYPLMGWFVRTFKIGNFLAVLSGTFAVFAFTTFILRFLRNRIGEEYAEAQAVRVSRLGTLVAGVVFLFTPAVQSASTHLEPRIFHVAWGLAAFLLLIPFVSLPRALAWSMPTLIGVMAGVGCVDSPIFFFALPLYFVGVWKCSRARGGRGYGSAAWFIVTMIVAFFTAEIKMIGDFTGWGNAVYEQTKGYFDGAYLTVLIVATIPFLSTLVACRKSFSGQSGWANWLFHLSITFMTILGVSALSPSAVMSPLGVYPIVTSVFVAFTAGYVSVYWQLQHIMSVRANESLDTQASEKVGKLLALVAGAVFAVAVFFTVVLNCATFDRDAGSFADKVANKILDDLGERTWFVTEGTLDDHLRFAARARKPEKKLNLICLQRENDKPYLEELSELVKSEKLGGSDEANANLRASLTLGILPFLQDWLAVDPDLAAKSIAIFSAPDLWYSARKGDVSLAPVPEFLFFGADAARFPSDADWSRAWEDFDAVLAPPRRNDTAKTWGSYELENEKHPLDRMRLVLRRHVGMVANNRGVRLQDAKEPEKAFAMFETVMDKIDADNVCSLFNELELAGAKLKQAVAKAPELERRINAIVADKARRYVLWRLGRVYGYIRSPKIFIELGYAWARSGRPGEALDQVRRAIDFIPIEKRSAVMNMMAALYASDSEGHKSREIYEKVLADDAENHDALIGLMRLELLDGDSAKAIEYLQRATEAAGDDPRANIEIALLHLMKNELAEAKALLRKATDADKANLQAWSLLAAVTMQQIDASTDTTEKQKLTVELESEILPTMEKQSRSPSDYYVQTVRAFVLMRRGEEHRRAARDAFVAAAKDRPDLLATGDIILGLDIALNDTEDAERQARDVLRRNRKAPLANYVMGSLALQKGQYVEAETFLRRSADAPRPVVLAMNDLAEVLRRTKDKDKNPLARLNEAQRYAEMATQHQPKLYVAWETLGAILLEKKEDFERAEKCVLKACELSRMEDGKEADVRMLVTLARVQLARGETMRGKGTLRKVAARINELSDYEKEEFEELRKSAK